MVLNDGDLGYQMISEIKLVSSAIDLPPVDTNDGKLIYSTIDLPPVDTNDGKLIYSTIDLPPVDTNDGMFNMYVPPFL